MNLWNVTVLAILKQGMNCDYDRLRTLANHYVPLRQMLGHGQPGFDFDQYSRQALVDNIALRLMCRVLEISESGYYKWCQRKPSRRAQENEKLVAAMRGIMVESKWTYGAPRMAAQLRRNGEKVSVNRVARLM